MNNIRTTILLKRATRRYILKRDNKIQYRYYAIGSM